MTYQIFTIRYNDALLKNLAASGYATSVVVFL
jgi:hypothetical protein